MCVRRALQVESTDVVMAEIDTVSNKFTPFAVTCSRMYFSLQQLPELYYLYQLSLAFFLEVVDRVLAIKPSAAGEILIQQLHRDVRCCFMYGGEHHVFFQILEMNTSIQ